MSADRFFTKYLKISDQKAKNEAMDKLDATKNSYVIAAFAAAGAAGPLLMAATKTTASITTAAMLAMNPFNLGQNQRTTSLFSIREKYWNSQHTYSDKLHHGRQQRSKEQSDKLLKEHFISRGFPDKSASTLATIGNTGGHLGQALKDVFVVKGLAAQETPEMTEGALKLDRLEYNASKKVKDMAAGDHNVEIAAVNDTIDAINSNTADWLTLRHHLVDTLDLSSGSNSIQAALNLTKPMQDTLKAYAEAETLSESDKNDLLAALDGIKKYDPAQQNATQELSENLALMCEAEAYRLESQKTALKNQLHAGLTTLRNKGLDQGVFTSEDAFTYNDDKVLNRPDNLLKSNTATIHKYDDDKGKFITEEHYVNVGGKQVPVKLTAQEFEDIVRRYNDQCKTDGDKLKIHTSWWDKSQTVVFTREEKPQMGDRKDHPFEIFYKKAAEEITIRNNTADTTISDNTGNNSALTMTPANNAAENVLAKLTSGPDAPAATVSSSRSFGA